MALKQILHEFKQRLTRIRNKDDREQRGEEATLNSAVLAAQRAPAEFATLMDCFAKLDGNTVGGFSAKWLSRQNIFLYGDSKVSFEYVTSETGEGEARIMIQNARRPFETKSQTIIMWPRYSTERQFTWKGEFPEDRELTSVDVAFYVLNRLNRIAKLNRTNRRLNAG